MPLRFPARKSGFTLAELLIALAILGVIATFTIPKVLQSQQDGKYKAIAKESAGMITSAYAAYQRQNTATGNTKSTDLIPYMNYVRYDTGLTVDDEYTAATQTCTSTDPCIVLHNGAVIYFWSTCNQFGGTATTNAVTFDLDPDGKVTDGTTNGPGKSIEFLLYYNGRLLDKKGAFASTVSAGGIPVLLPSRVPPWFSWD